MLAAIGPEQLCDICRADPNRLRSLKWRNSGRRSGACWRVILAGSSRSRTRRLDLDEERDLDCELETEFPLAEEVTDHLAEDAEPTAGGGEELSELLHSIFSLRNADIVGMGRMTDKEGRT